MTVNGNRIAFLIEPGLLGSGAWLALREDLLPGTASAAERSRELARRFAAVQVWFSDLDDFDTASPAKIIAMRAVGTGHLRAAYLGWMARTLILFLRHGKKRAEAMSWRLYHDAFLKEEAGRDWLKEEAFRYIDELLTPEGTARLLYPGVEDFYAAFAAEKYLVTRNLERIAYRYSKVLPYSGYYHEVSDKAALVESFLSSRPEVRRYGLGGDSEEDSEAAAFLERRYRAGAIERPICLGRAESPNALAGDFNVFVGRDRSALARIIARQTPSAAG